MAWRFPNAASNGRRRKNEETRVTNFICMRYLLMEVLSKTMKCSIKKTVRRKDVKGKNVGEKADKKGVGK
jgi:hypothetical protein